MSVWCRWTDTAYQGKTYLPLSSASDKVTTAKGEKDAINSATLTWGTRRRPDEDLGDGSGYFTGYGVVHPTGYEESRYLRSSSSAGVGGGYYGGSDYAGANAAYPRGSLGKLYAPRYDTATTAAPVGGNEKKSYLQGSVGELKPPAFDTNTTPSLEKIAGSADKISAQAKDFTNEKIAAATTKIAGVSIK